MARKKFAKGTRLPLMLFLLIVLAVISVPFVLLWVFSAS